MTPTFYDQRGNPTSRWCETPYYPENKREEVWLTVKEAANAFEVVGDASSKVLVVSPENYAALKELAESISPDPNMATDSNAVQLAKAVLALLKG